MRYFSLALTLVLGISAYRTAKGMDLSFGASTYMYGVLRNTLNPVRQGDINWVRPEDKWQEMTSRFEKMAASFHGRMGIYFKDLRTGREWTYRPDDIFPAASLIKVPIMISAFHKIRQQELSLYDDMVLAKGMKRGGSGQLRRLRYGTRLTVSQLLEKMITDSDNTATQMMIDELGYDYLSKKFSDIGLVYTQISPEGMSLVSHGVEKENFTTPREMAMMVEGIYRGTMVGKEESFQMLEIMKRTRHHSRFAKNLPKGWQLAHKTGMLRLACHDVGIFFAPKGDYLLAVLTWKVPDYHYAANYISRVSAVAHKYYSEQPNIDPPSRTRRRRRR